MKNKNEARLKVVLISPEFIFNTISLNKKIIDVIGVPITAAIRGMYVDQAKQCFALIIYDESFDLLSEGELIPELPIVCRILK